MAQLNNHGSSGIYTAMRVHRLAENAWFFGFKLPKLLTFKSFTEQTKGL